MATGGRGFRRDRARETWIVSNEDQAIPERPRRFEALITNMDMQAICSGDQREYLATWNSTITRRAEFRGCNRGHGDASRSRIDWVPARAHPERCGFHPLPRAVARQPIARPRSGANRRTPVAREPPAASARILARKRNRS
jgi:hypothetical protein